MEERKKTRQVSAAAAAAGNTALTATSSRPTTDSSGNLSDTRNNNRNKPPASSSSGRQRGRGRGRSFSGRGGRSNSIQNPTSLNQNWAQNPWGAQWAGAPFPWNILMGQQMGQPPCPYPSTPRPNSTPGAGILGPRPSQAYTAGFTPTDIAQALYTLSLNQPDNSVMDSGASGHMGNKQGPQDTGTYPTMQ